MRPNAAILQRGALLALLFTASCADDQDGNDLFDGNFIVGDAAEGDRGPGLDALQEDVDQGLRDAGDAGLGDVEEDAAADLGLLDASPPDGEPEDAGPDPCDVVPELTLTASAAFAQAQSLDGRPVAIEGVLGLGPVLCTDRACPVEDPCCNSCTASLRLDEILPVVSSACLTNVGCDGDDCGLVCRPAVLGGAATYVGIVRDDPVAGGQLELISVNRP